MINKVSFPLGISHSDITLLFCYDSCSPVKAIFIVYKSFGHSYFLFFYEHYGWNR